MTDLIINAIVASANALETKAIANLNNYLSNSVGVGEHPDIVEEARKQVLLISEAREIKQTILDLMPKKEESK